jgi:PAS domain S-box-containing protein
MQPETRRPVAVENNLGHQSAAIVDPPIPFPADGQPGHMVLFYRHDDYLLDALSEFIGNALRSGDPAVVVATQEHRDDLADRLYRRGIDVGELLQNEVYIELDAAETLKEFMVDGMPDAERFKSTVGSLLERTRKIARNGKPVTIYGEMVALLWKDGMESAALCLEEYWNELAETNPISLCCGYPLKSFPGMNNGDSFRRVCAKHAVVIPAEGFSLLGGMDERLRSVACLQQESQALETEAQLRRGEAIYRNLVESVQEYAIFALNSQGLITTWNAGAERILGFEEAEILGRHFSCFFTEEDILSGKPEWELQAARSQGRFEVEGWRLRKDGWKFYTTMVLTALRDEAGTFIGYAVGAQDITEQTIGREPLGEIRENILESEKSLRQFSLLVMRRQEEERRRVGEDLLDSLGQYLSVLNMKLDSMRTFAEERESKGNEEMAQCLNLVEESIKEVRAISYLLYPPLLEEVGLRPTIPWYLEGFTKRSGIKTSFKISPDFRRISNDASVAIFRVLQEALSNVQKHSGSTTADIQLLTRNNCVLLIISDAGKGIPSELFTPGNGGPSRLGMGLRGMSERLRCLGGRLEITSSGKGATITATIPLACCSPVAMSA